MRDLKEFSGNEELRDYLAPDLGEGLRTHFPVVSCFCPAIHFFWMLPIILK